MARQRAGATVTRRGRPPKPPVAQEPKVEVPVHRLAEYVPASFTASTDNENDPLNADDARWYKTGEGKLLLVLGNAHNDFALEFQAEALCALSERAKSMSVTDVDDLLDLV